MDQVCIKKLSSYPYGRGFIQRRDRRVPGGFEWVVSRCTMPEVQAHTGLCQVENSLETRGDDTKVDQRTALSVRSLFSTAIFLQATRGCQ